MNAIGSSSWLWPTPLSSNHDRGGRHAINNKAGRELAEEVRRWPTPTVTNCDQGADKRGTREGSPSLIGEVSAWATPNEQVTHWPTPTTRDAANAARHTTTTGVMHPGTSLIDAVRRHTWPTPTAEQYGSSQNGICRDKPSGNTPSLDRLSRSFLQDLTTSSAGAPSSPSGQSSRQQLNPLFDEWLMGLPIGWTAFAPVGTEWCHWLQRSRFAFLRLVSACGLPVADSGSDR